MTKKDALKEMAVALVLLREFSQDLAADIDDEDCKLILNHTQERAQNALHSAAHYTGISNIEDVRKLLQAEQDRFTIESGADIMKGDSIRFTEAAYDNRKRPPLYLGRRVVSAEVLDMQSFDSNPLLTLRVIETYGTWKIRPKTEVKRYLRNIVHFGVRRIPWDDEDKRSQLKKGEDGKEKSPAVLQNASKQMFGRYDSLRAEEDKDRR